MKPRSSSTSAPASSGRSNSASTITAVSATGPPTYTGSSSPASQERSGTASPTVEAAGRFSTSPMAPSSVCSAIRTTVRMKLGSRRTGDARMSLPRNDSAIPTLCLVARPHGFLLLFLVPLGGLRLGRGLLLALLGGLARGPVEAGGADRRARRGGGAGAAVLVAGHDRDPQAATEVPGGGDVGGACGALDVLPAAPDQSLPLIGVAGGRIGPGADARGQRLTAAGGPGDRRGGRRGRGRGHPQRPAAAGRRDLTA